MNIQSFGAVRSPIRPDVAAWAAASDDATSGGAASTGTPDAPGPISTVATAPEIGETWSRVTFLPANPTWLRE